MTQQTKRPNLLPYLLVLLVFVVLLIAVCAAAIYAFITRTRINQQLKASMDEQNRMTTEMEEMTQTQLQFFTNVSHELRTPLTLIAGPTEQLLEDPAVHGVQRTMLEMVQRNTRILIQLVGEILDFRKVQNNKAHLHLNRFALQRELATWANDFRAVAARRKITIDVDASEVRQDAVIIADRDKLEHIYFNLMSNALKYTPEGGRITTALSYDGKQYVLSVSDTGKGIEEEALPHLFDRFFQARGAVGGTGIGLSLVKAYVDLHHGDIRVESNEGEGTRFFISLPAAQPGYDPAKDREARPVAERELVDDSYVPEDINAKEAANRITNAEDFDADRPLVLIIDDNNGMRAYLRSILKDRYNVSEAADGRQGLEKARHEVPKLIVCDVMMPVMDGWAVCRAIRAESQTPVIMLTAKGETEDKVSGLEMGADDYIVKPFEMKELMARINAVLRRSEIPDDTKKKLVFDKLEEAVSYAYAIKGQGHKYILLENDLTDNY